MGLCTAAAVIALCKTSKAYLAVWQTPCWMLGRTPILLYRRRLHRGLLLGMFTLLFEAIEQRTVVLTLESRVHIACARGNKPKHDAENKLSLSHTQYPRYQPISKAKIEIYVICSERASKIMFYL